MPEPFVAASATAEVEHGVQDGMVEDVDSIDDLSQTNSINTDEAERE
jgi:hypothetical protein